MTDWERLTPEQQAAMSPDFWAGLSEEERQARARLPTDEISEEARAAYRPEAPDGPQ